MNRKECNLSLDELLKFEGVMASGIFSPEGKLVDYKSNTEMPKEMAQMTAKFCGAVNTMFDVLASAYTQLYKMNWIPQHNLSLIHISEPTRRTPISYAVFCLKKKKTIK